MEQEETIFMRRGVTSRRGARTRPGRVRAPLRRSPGTIQTQKMCLKYLQSK